MRLWIKGTHYPFSRDGYRGGVLLDQRAEQGRLINGNLDIRGDNRFGGQAHGQAYDPNE